MLLFFVAVCPIAAFAITQEELDAQRILWNAHGFRDYDYVLQRQCHCIEPAGRPGQVQVRGGAITAVTDVDTLQPLNPLFFRTIDGLFDELQNAIDVSADDIAAQFDNTYSYPTSIWIDFDLGIADEELIYLARDLRVIEIPGDFDGDGVLDVDDLDSLTTAIANGDTDKRFDVDESGVIDLEDRFHWVKVLKHTWVGDANLNGEFSSGDFTQVFIAGEYEDAIDDNSGWAEGDWDGDRDFTSGDFVVAFLDGGYEQEPRAAVSAVPEPATILLTAISLLGVVRFRTK